MQPFFHSFVSKMGKYLSPFTAELTPIMITGYKAFKASVMKPVQIEEHRFGVEPEILAKIACTAVSYLTAARRRATCSRAASSRKSRSTFSTRSCGSS